MEAKSARPIDGKQIAARLHAEVERAAGELRGRGLEPHLVAVQAGADAASGVYIEKQRERFAALGIRYTHAALGPGATLADLERRVGELNRDPAVTGIMVMQPLPPDIPAAR